MSTGIIAKEVGKGLIVRMALWQLANVVDEVKDELGPVRSNGDTSSICLLQKQKVAKKRS